MWGNQGQISESIGIWACIWKKVGEETLKTLEELGLPLKLLMSISSDGPNVNKTVKANINAKLKQCFKRQTSQHRFLSVACSAQHI